MLSFEKTSTVYVFTVGLLVYILTLSGCLGLLVALHQTDPASSIAWLGLCKNNTMLYISHEF